MSEAKSLKGVFDDITEYFSPEKVGRVGDLNVMCSKVKGLYHWHKHDSAEEFFYIHKGKMTVHYKDRDVEMAEGDIHTVAKGAIHRTFSEEGAEVFFISPDDWIEVPE